VLSCIARIVEIPAGKNLEVLLLGIFYILYFPPEADPPLADILLIFIDFRLSLYGRSFFD